MTLVFVAATARVVFPEYIVTVQQFEISPEVATKLSITGKGASDLVIDILNRTATDGSLFEGSDYYRYDHHGAQPVALKGTIKTPVENSYGIEVSGISLDSLFKLYDQIRYQQWVIGGDIVSSPEGIIAKIRLNRDGSAKSWQTEPQPDPVASKLIENATALMLAEENPELLGRAYLREGKYTEAAQVFRIWALRSPRYWMPFYYLSLSYDYLGEEEKASNLANWSAKIMNGETNTKTNEPVHKGFIDSATVSGLAKVTHAVWETRSASNIDAIDALSRTDKVRTLEAVERSIASLTDLSNRTHEDPTYKIQLARLWDEKAAIEASLSPTSVDAYTDQQQAVDLLQEVVKQLPNNGGLHEQHGILLQHLVKIAEKEGQAPDVIQKARDLEIAEFTKALELQPTQLSPLWGAVYALLDSKQTAEAVDLSRTIGLLQPESTTAQTAYILSLEHVIKEAGKSAESETEVESHLKAVLGKLSPSELDALLRGFVYAADRRSLLETLDTYRELAKAKPPEHLPDLALTLNALGELYRQNQELNQAADAYTEALGIYRKLGTAKPQEHLPNLALTLNALGELYRQNQQLNQAADSYTEALGIYRKLAKTNPQTYEQNIAKTLDTLDNLHRQSPRFSRATVTIQKHVQAPKQDRAHSAVKTERTESALSDPTTFASGLSMRRSID